MSSRRDVCDICDQPATYQFEDMRFCDKHKPIDKEREYPLDEDQARIRELIRKVLADLDEMLYGKKLTRDQVLSMLTQARDDTRELDKLVSNWIEKNKQ